MTRCGTDVFVGQDLDEADLLAELEELEQEELDKQMLDVGPTPTTKLPGSRFPFVFENLQY